ncbi:hypothetical protein HBI59_128590 [Parastagonospora nodorum]|nr:hypothetical protein HBI59_128590 [Parastagonospora nodorum]
MTSTHCPLRELGARHSLSNLSIHDLVEERRNYSLSCKLSDLYKAGTSPVIDTLTVTPIEDNDNLLNTIDSHIKLRKLKEVREADASKQVDANVREGGNKNRSSLYYSDSNSDTATKKTRIKACAQLIERQRLELEAQLRKASKEEELDSPLDSNDYRLDSSPDINPEDDSEDEEATTAKDLAREQKERLKALLNAKYNERQSLCESRDGNRTLHSGRGGYCDSTLYQLTGAYILYFKELLSNNSRIFASVIGITRTRAIVLSAIIGHVHFKN